MKDDILPSKVCSHCGGIGHVIDTCYKKHGFPPQFKFKNQKVDCNSNQQNHKGSRSKVHSQQIGFILSSNMKHC